MKKLIKFEKVVLILSLILPLLSYISIASLFVYIILFPIACISLIYNLIGYIKLKIDNELCEKMKLKKKKLYCYTMLIIELIILLIQGILMCGCGHHYYHLNYLYIFFVIYNILYCLKISKWIDENKKGIGLIILLFIMISFTIFLVSKNDMDKLHTIIGIY